MLISVVYLYIFILLYICTNLFMGNPSLREYLEHHSVYQVHLSDVPHLQARDQC